jgi:hypothetical protein
VPRLNIELSALLRRNGTVTVEYYFIVYRIDDGHEDIPGVLRIRTSASDLTLVEGIVTRNVCLDDLVLMDIGSCFKQFTVPIPVV